MMGFHSCIRWFFYLMTGILFILGLASLGTGIWMAVDSESFLDFTRIGDVGSLNPDLVRVSGYVMIASGGATAVIALVGIVGVAMDNFCILGLFVVVLVLALAVQVAAMLLGVIFRKQIEKKLDDRLTERINKDYQGPGDQGSSFTTVFNAFMRKAECCGVRNGTEDFKETEQWIRNSSIIVPNECCIDFNSVTCQTNPDSTNYYDTGCLDKIFDVLYKYHAVVIGISAGVVGFQFILVTLSICLFSMKRPSYTVDRK